MPFQYVEKWKPVSAWGKSMESYLAAQGIVLQVKYEMQSVIAARPPKPKKIKPIKIKPMKKIKHCACGNTLASFNISGTCWTCKQRVRVVRPECSKDGCTRKLYTNNTIGICHICAAPARKKACAQKAAA